MFLATGNFFHTSPLNRCINEFIFRYYKLLKAFYISFEQFSLNI